MSAVLPSQAAANRVAPIGAYLLALVLPPMFAFSITPSPTLLNQLLSVAGWGLCLALHRSVAPTGARGSPTVVLTAAFALLVAGVVSSWTVGSLPTSLALPPLGLLIAACALAALAARAAQSAGAEGIEVFLPFAVGLVAAGLLSAGVAVVQVFFPEAPDGDWIARSGLVGRAVGNLRQPNHLASLLLWSLIALVPLVEWRRIPRWLGAILAAVLVLGVILSGSRTGQYGGLVVLVAWGAADFRMSKPMRLALSIGVPVVGVALWFGVAHFLNAQHQVFGAQARLSEGDSSHFAIWRNTWSMIQQQPWLGVGWGEFNFAWTLTPFPDRPVAFFDHTHNLELQLMVELGLPLSLLVIALLAVALWQSARRAWSEPGPAGHGARAAFVMVMLIAVHSQDEYPLWYAYFLLPAAWAWGFALGSGPAPARSAGTAPAEDAMLIRLGSEGVLLRWVGVLMFAVAVAAFWDYRQVSTIFAEDEGLPSLAARISRGQRSLLFAHHADYADATTAEPPSHALGALERATHSLIDTRLMIAWATALDESGQPARARYIAARLREFRKEDAAEFFAPCADPAKAGALPFQCQPEPKGLTWRDFH
jgi:O-antigen ligase